MSVMVLICVLVELSAWILGFDWAEEAIDKFNLFTRKVGKGEITGFDDFGMTKLEFGYAIATFLYCLCLFFILFKGGWLSIASVIIILMYAAKIKIKPRWNGFFSDKLYLVLDSVGSVFIFVTATVLHMGLLTFK